MKQVILITATLSAILMGCGQGADVKNDGSVKLVFQPQKDKPVKMQYEFIVNSVTAGNHSHFYMDISGSAGGNDNGEVMLSTHNDKISMDGNVEGRDVKFVAGSNDSIPSDVVRLLTPVFSLLNKNFTGVYDSHLNKISEMMQNSSGGMDSIENKMAFFVRYPDSSVKVGDSWKRELVIKTGNKMNCSATYTLKEIKDGHAIITVEGKLSGKGESFGHEFTIDGKLSGDITVDIASGWPLNTNINQDFVLDLDGQKIQMQYTIKHVITP